MITDSLLMLQISMINEAKDKNPKKNKSEIQTMFPCYFIMEHISLPLNVLFFFIYFHFHLGVVGWRDGAG